MLSRRIISTVQFIPNFSFKSTFPSSSVNILKKTRLSTVMPKSCLQMTKNRILSPPDHVRGMTVLDKDQFKRVIKVPTIRVKKECLDQVIPKVKSVLLKMKDINPVQDEVDGGQQKIILLNPDMVESIEDIGEKQHEELKKFEITNLNFKELQLSYDNFSCHQIFDAVLPNDQFGVAGFSQIGHLIHFNLKEHTLPYKHLIGQVMIDKNKNAKIVVNKTKTIDNEFRNFNMEVIGEIAGEKVDTNVHVVENGVKFEFDFSKVYWNPKLSTEHDRVVSKLSKHKDILYDVFAGVGPFAIPAAKLRKCETLANDLNPDCYKWLKHNASLNASKATPVDKLVIPFNLDGREFIKTVLREDMIERWNKIDFTSNHQEIPQFHIAMNLPAIAITFLDAFKLLFHDQEFISAQMLPLVHCYCFVKDEPNHADSVVKDMVEKVIESQLIDVKEIVNVRHVAPNKDMFRISFIMPENVLFGVNKNKRQKIE